MKKVALVFVLAVFVPSLLLAWLAVRSLRDQELRLERQQSLLYQGIVDAKARAIQEVLAECQRAFQARLAGILEEHATPEAARNFDTLLRQDWPLAQVGFAVSLTGDLLSPPAASRPDATSFRAQNHQFLANRESAEVYWNNALGQSQTVLPNPGPGTQAAQLSDSSQRPGPSPQAPGRSAQPQVLGAPMNGLAQSHQSAASPSQAATLSQTPQTPAPSPPPPITGSLQQFPTLAQDGSAENIPGPATPPPEGVKRPAFKSQSRNVVPQQPVLNSLNNGMMDNNQNSKLAAASGEFRQLIGEARQGVLARFVNNQLNVLLWQRPERDPGLVFGAQLSLPRLVEQLHPFVMDVPNPLSDEICLALLNDQAKPAALSHPQFRAPWKHPFVATEISEVLPHWELAIYLLDPGRFARSAQAARLTLGLLIAVLVLAIGVGGWLIVADLNRQLALARQKTDFVSNVSHELKTPLTSIRMFSELLAEGRVGDPEKQRAYLGIITAEAGRLTRLINNVLDFARLERGEKKYQFERCDAAALVSETASAYRPHLESLGFRFDCELAETPLFVRGDPDALAQVLVNLLSNAEKYCGQSKEITLRARRSNARLPLAEIQVLDRGLGVPPGCKEKIFENFFRAHDSLSSGIQGSGLGLTIARQIARAHGGDVLYEPREGAGSCFSLRLPLTP